MGKIYARVFQACFKVGMAVLPWRIPETLEGPDCIKKLPARIKKDGFHKVLVVTDAVLMKLGALNGLFAAMDEAALRIPSTIRLNRIRPISMSTTASTYTRPPAANA